MADYNLPTFSVALRVDAPAAEVWKHVSDLEAQAAGSKEFMGGDWLDGGGPETVGSKFVGRQQHETLGEWETTSIVTESVVGECFEWAVSDTENPSARWRFDLEAGDGVTVVRQTCIVGPGPSGLTAAIDNMPDREQDIVKGRVGYQTQNMVRTIYEIKSRAEAVDAS